MDKKLFEEKVHSGDLIFLVCDNLTDRSRQRIIRTGIYLSDSNSLEYGGINSFGVHLLPSKADPKLHGWDFSAQCGEFGYKDVIFVQVVRTKKGIEGMVEKDLGQLAKEDYKVKFRE